jgi:hypothetical protein
MKFDELYKQIIGEGNEDVQKKMQALRDRKGDHAGKVETAAKKGNISKETGEVEDDDVDSSLEDVKKSTEETAKAVKAASMKR